ncbi:hypothetical protein ACFLXT_00225 [Chloroflexota bacterium]
MVNGQSQAAKSAASTGAARLHYLDWLRVIAMLSIFLYHSDRLFDSYPWHIKNDVTSLVSSIHLGFPISIHYKSS